jgi:DNA repair ATPase RecN
MRSSALMTSLLLGLSLVAFGCAGSKNKEASTAETTKADISPMDQLKAIPDDLNNDVNGLMQPIDDTQATIDQVTSIPKRYKLNAKDVMGMASASISSGQVNVNFDAAANVQDDAKAEVNTAITRLVGVVNGLKATPDRVAALTQKLGTVSAKVPVLATRATSEATVTVSNPFASAEAKTKAKADIENVKQMQATITKTVQDTQAKISGVPAMATTALGKITKAFAGV